jgi:hypothetical protein
VLGRKGSLRRAQTGRALASCAPFCHYGLATGGSGRDELSDPYLASESTTANYLPDRLHKIPDTPAAPGGMSSAMTLSQAS